MKSSAQGLGLAAVVEDIPISLTLSNSDATQAMRNFCKDYSSSTQFSQSQFSFKSAVVEKAFGSANECLTIATSGNSLSYSIMTPDTLSIDFYVGAGNRINIQGISHAASVTCVGAGDGGRQITYDEATMRAVSASVHAYPVTCNRTASSTVGGTKTYDEQAIIVSTNAGDLHVYWPQNSVTPVRDADAINKRIDALDQRLVGTDAIARTDQGRLDTISRNYSLPVNGTLLAGLTDVTQPHPQIRMINSVSCPNGQYLSGLELHWTVTCQGQCNADGGLLHEIVPICKTLF